MGRDDKEWEYLSCEVTKAVADLIELNFSCPNMKYKKTCSDIGLAKDNLVPNEMLDKDTIEYPRFDYNKCIGCGRCYISCRDGGHNAIIFDKERIPSINYSKCVGCQLCKVVCPTLAIERAVKRTTITDKTNSD